MVNLVGDWYGVQFSLKEPERARRQKTQDESRTCEIEDNLSIPTWKSFTANTKNKAVLQGYRAETWCKHPEMVLEMCSLSLEASPVNMSSFKEMDQKHYHMCRVNLTRKQIHVSSTLCATLELLKCCDTSHGH